MGNNEELNVELLKIEIEGLKEQIEKLKESSAKEIRQAYSDVEEYFYVVSHELKEPIREVDLYTKFIEEDSGELLLPESVEDLKSIHQTCSKMIEMIENFVEYSKASQKILDRNVIQLKPLLTKCFDGLARSNPSRNLELEVLELPDIIGDEFLIRQMIVNILSNSVKFTKNTFNAKIKVYTYEENDSVSFCFEDNGAGFEMKYASGIFEMFERIHDESDFGGYGIGLATVKKIVDRFEGTIEIFGKINKGCVVTIKFPKSMVKLADVTGKNGENKKDKIVIGTIGASSGDYASIAPCRQLAYELAVEEINSNGGIGGKQVELLFRDFNSDTSLCSEMAWELMEVHQADVIMGGQISSAREEIRKVADKTKTLYFFEALYEGGLADHYTFCISAAPEQNLYPMLNYLYQNNVKKFYIITSDYNYGILSAESAKYYIEKLGGEVIAIEYFYASKSNFDVTIDNIKDVNPDAILSFCVSKNQNNFYKQWYEKGIRSIPIVSTIGIGLSYLHKIFEPPVMNNVYFMSSYIEELQTEAAKAFTNKLRNKFGIDKVRYIEFDAETAYTSVYLYKKAVEIAGSTDTEAVIKALESGLVSFKGPGGNVTVRGEEHHVIRDMNLLRVGQNHKIEVIQEFPQMYSDFVEKLIREEFGVKGGLRTCGLNAPNMQYNLMFHKILQEPNRFLP
ncbi:MAG: transporter substrate-binding protein [Lachnospiraceae bacterium]|nr:transporter substrate-binding protein [Lachnospiraceae bacterium]